MRAPFTLALDDGESIRARAIVVATGARYRKLDVAGYERFEGAGIYYAATAMEADLCAEQEIVVVGGGNSAGQAAVFLARSAKHVHMLVRGAGLAATMSDYLVQRIERSDKITLYPHAEITALTGDASLQSVTWTDRRSANETTRPATSVFVMIGAEPNTQWAAGCLDLDPQGFVRTGAHAGADADSPYATSRRGVFAVGDVRSGSVKRVASSVGEGSVVVQSIHRYLNPAALEVGTKRVVALRTMLEPGDHAPLDVPAVGRVGELVDQPLLGAAALVLVGEHQFGQAYPRFQPGVASQPDDVAHARALAPAQQSLAAEPRVGAHDDPALGPGPAQPLHQQLDHGRGVLGPVDATAPQHARQHRLAAEHVQRQVAVVVIVGVELGTLLVAVQRHVGGVDVEHQFSRWRLVAGDELIDEHAMQCNGLRPRRPRLQAAQRGRARQRIDPADRGLHQQVVSQRVVVVEVFVATAQAVDALGQEISQAVRDARRVARITQHRGRRAAQTDPLVGPSQ